MTLTKANLAVKLYEQVGLNNREAKEMVETFFKEISDCLVRGEEVKLAGFGVFNMRDKPERRPPHWRQRKKRTFTRPDLTTVSELPFVRNEGQFRSRDIPSRWGRRLAQLRSRCFRFPKT